MHVKAYAALAAQTELQPYRFELENLKADEAEIEVLYCGLCHSDLSMLDNDWGQSEYPLVPGHEIIGRVSKLGSQTKNLKIGQYVGLGWQSNHCQCCQPCLTGQANLCRQSQATIIGRHGGFASHVRAHWQWVIPLPEDLELKSAGPLLCAGLTVFTPLLQHGIQAIHHVGVIGIGGLGHIAIKLYKAWGCKVTAFSSKPEKEGEILELGADHVINTHDLNLAPLDDFDLIVDTINVPLEWSKYIALLAPQGKFHLLGLVQEDIQISSFELIDKQACITGSPTGTPFSINQLLSFCSRHNIQAQVEEFPISQVNRAIQKLREGQVRYRVVLNMQELHDAEN